MTERPILFSKPMVQAILDGRKTQTRRVVKTVSSPKYGELYPVNSEGIGYYLALGDDNDKLISHYKSGKVGDVLWVRESHYRFGKWVKNGLTKSGKQAWKFKPESNFGNIRYMDNPPASIESNSYRKMGWYQRPSIFLPYDCARIWLKITDIRVERLQDISEEDAKAEGVHAFDDEAYKDYQFDVGHYSRARGSFFSLWISINGEESHYNNPWVWVVEFEKTTKP